MDETAFPRGICPVPQAHQFHRPFLFLTTIIVAFWILIGRSKEPEMGHHIEYSTVTGYFLQDDPATEPQGFDFVRD
jgi:hypothetical protein